MTQKLSIILVEDEQNICDFVSAFLTAQGYQITCCGSGKEAISMIASHVPDLVLLDLGLPDMDGMEVLRRLRSWSGIPVIVISARSGEADKVEALDAGADDYVTKPVGTAELLARIRTAIRHSNRRLTEDEHFNRPFRSGDLEVDFEKHQVTVAGKPVHLTQIEFRIISLLARNSGRVMTYDAIISQIWGPYADSNNSILRVNMAHIRRKLEENPAEPRYICTEMGIGYRMAEEGTN